MLATLSEEDATYVLAESFLSYFDLYGLATGTPVKRRQKEGVHNYVEDDEEDVSSTKWYPNYLGAVSHLFHAAAHDLTDAA